MNSCLHTTDFFGWANQQAALLRAGRIAEIDREHLAEEIEDMGKSLHRELLNRLTVLFLHLLKWQHQPGYQGNSWQYAIEEQREQIADHLQDNPSLKQKLPESIERAYKYARTGAAKETGLPKDVFPETCPWSFEQALDDAFWPA
jgi:predicted  nucleic acid-binding Zn-ribbon protein